MCKFMFLSMVTVVFTWIVAAETGSIQSGGQTRTFIFHVPSGLPENPPLVLSMHGLGGSGSQQESMTGFDKIADLEKFIVVYPDGTYKFSGSNGWDVSGKTTDTDFLAALIDTMIAHYKADPKRVYCTGFSMGGMISYCMACTHPDKLAAIGPCSGYNPCTPKGMVSICHIHGTSDQMVAYKDLAGIIDKWVTYDGCPQNAQVTQPYPASNPNSKVKKEYWSSYKDDLEIVVLTVDGMDHAYPSSMMGTKDIVASEEFWTFFKKHPAAVGSLQRPQSSVKRFVSAKYNAGKVNLQSYIGIYSVKVVDLQGKTILAWKAKNGPVKVVTFSVNRFMGEMCLISVSDGTGSATLRLLCSNRRSL